MKGRAGSVFLAGNSVRLFKRGDRPTRFWQAAFRRPGEKRPLVKSTGQAEIEAARRWAQDYLALLQPPDSEPDSKAPSEGGRENLLGAFPFPKIRQEKRHVERELALRTLSAYADDPLISQRRLALALNVSLAVVNVYTARAVREGWLVKLARGQGRAQSRGQGQRQGSGYRYLLTEPGRRQVAALTQAYVAQELGLYRRLRAAFTGLLAAGDNDNIVLAGSGDLVEIAQGVLAAHGTAPLMTVAADDLDQLTRHAVKRHRHRLIVWLAEPGAAEAAAIRSFLGQHLPGVPIHAVQLLGDPR